MAGLLYNLPAMAERYGLPRQLRLHLRRDFARIFARRCRASDRLLVIYADRNNLGYSRLAVMTPRRLGRAVQRNRLRRLIREAYRLAQHELPAGYDLICIPVAGCGASVGDYQQSLRRLMAGLVMRLERSRR